ncbi:hypothetical protein KSS93_25030 [Pseudomonas xanthosomatis]|uniref:hypothetical protein n=1 Tax=Pseudomonas xanthosomatis TaxID=2842356 RepID=UPI001C3DC298|nr:hypothetical protein [Pseudomonas xanthosomatis]QXH46090.1 hypothetical protein KSS93_25030 [Pseudomonas xanthosomatis]
MPALYLTFSLLLYLSSLCFDAVLTGAGRHLPALQILLYGLWGIPFEMYQWFANPLLALAILAHRRFRWLALGFGLVALYLAISSLGIERLPDSRTYGFQDVTGFGAGYYLWLGAILLFCTGQAWWCWKAKSAAQVPGWRWFDVALMAALGVAFYVGTQMPSMRFEPHKVVAPPEPQPAQML